MTTIPAGMTPARLAEIRALADAATPGPWYVQDRDDDHAMSLVAIATTPDDGRGERIDPEDAAEIIAATLVQQPRYVNIADKRWDENAEFIADARQAVPELVAEVERLNAELRKTAAMLTRAWDERGEAETQRDLAYATVEELRAQVAAITARVAAARELLAADEDAYPDHVTGWDITEEAYRLLGGETVLDGGERDGR